VSSANSSWFLLNSGPDTAARNMALDAALLEAGRDLPGPVLRFYAWTEPAASFGYFQKFADIEKMTLLRPLVRRPTGGGLVPHDADWTYSLTFPAQCDWHSLSASDSYRRVHEWIGAAFAKIGVPTEVAPACRKTLPGQCFAGHEKSDLLWHGRKIAGAAQRRTRNGLLIQGSVQPPPIQIARADWERAMLDTAPIHPAGPAAQFIPGPALWQRRDELASATYSQASHNRRR
jgi:lipoate-protein ligase A